MSNLDVTYRNLRFFAKELTAKIRSKIDEYDLRASYNLYNNVDVRVVRNGELFHININLEDYWYYIENGRKPNNRFPPVEAVKHWIQIKPIVARMDDSGRTPTENQLAYLIGRKIARDGIDGIPFLSESIEEMLERFYEILEESLTLDFEAEIKEILKINTKLSHIKFS